MLVENSLARRVLATFMILMGVVGLVAVVALAVLWSVVGGDVDRMWTSSNSSLRESTHTVRQGSEAVSRAGNMLLEMEQSVNATSLGLNSMIDGLSSVREANLALGEGLMATGEFLTLAGGGFQGLPELGGAGNALSNAGERTIEAAAQFETMDGNWREIEVRVTEIRDSLENTRGELPALRENLEGVSTGLANTASSLASVEDTSEGLRQSGLLSWMAVVVLLYFGVLALSMVLAGVLLF